MAQLQTPVSDARRRLADSHIDVVPLHDAAEVLVGGEDTMEAVVVDVRYNHLQEAQGEPRRRESNVRQKGRVFRRLNIAWSRINVLSCLIHYQRNLQFKKHHSQINYNIKLQ